MSFSTVVLVQVEVVGAEQKKERKKQTINLETSVLALKECLTDFVVFMLACSQRINSLQKISYLCRQTARNKNKSIRNL